MVGNWLNFNSIIDSLEKKKHSIELNGQFSEIQYGYLNVLSFDY